MKRYPEHPKDITTGMTGSYMRRVALRQSAYMKAHGTRGLRADMLREIWAVIHKHDKKLPPEEVL